MYVRLVDKFEAWRSHAPAWGCLTRGTPFRSWDWLATWWEQYGNGSELAILTVYDDREQLIGAVPWCVTPGLSSGRVLHPIGQGEVCTDYATVLCGPEHESAVCTAIAAYLVSSSGMPTWDLLKVDCVPVTDRPFLRLVDSLRERGCSANRAPDQRLWSIPLPATWPEYLGMLSKSHRKQIQRLIRELGDSGRASLRQASSPEEVERDMDLLVDMHQRRWRLAGQPGAFAGPRFTKFLRDVAQRFAARQELLLSTLLIDGRPAAIDFHLVTTSANYVYQGAIEPELADLSPGRLLMTLLIQDAIERGRTEFDLLRGDESYKPHFRAVATETSHWRIVPQHVSAQLRNGLWLTGKTMKQVVKAGLSLTGFPANPPPTTANG